MQKIGKNRTMPFGYMMKNGAITTDSAEVLAVLTIFSEYMAGKSLNEIARNMYKKVRQMESDNKDILLQFQDEYPDVTNTDNVNDILAAIKKKKNNK